MLFVLPLGCRKGNIYLKYRQMELNIQMIGIYITFTQPALRDPVGVALRRHVVSVYLVPVLASYHGEERTVPLNYCLQLLHLYLSEQTANETKTYIQHLKLEQGELPVRWYLSQGPEGMTVDEKTGFVRWANTFGNSEVYHIDVRASNIIGEDSQTWSLLVPLSYRAYVTHIQPSGVFPVPRPVIIYGNIAFTSEETARAAAVEVMIVSSRSKLETFLEARSDQNAPDTFMAIYYPRLDDAGLFTVSARHPGNFLKLETSNVTWSVLGMKCEPSATVVNEIISADEDTVVVTNLSTLYNVGNLYIDNITAEVDGLSDAFTRRSGEFDNRTLVIERMHVNDSVSFDLVITNAKPLYGIFYIIFTTNQGTSTGIRVDIKLSIRKPVLIFRPALLRESIVRGTMKVLDINITNVGEVTANNLSVSLPSDSRFSLVSFTSEDNWTKGLDNSGIVILPKASAQLSIGVIITDTDPLGEISGHIYINSVSTSSRLPYTVFITSARMLNVTFTVKDEYTYFATGSPLVTNATVRLSSPRRDFAETKYSENETGFVVFENINEDQYTLYAEAENHSSYTAVILITDDKTQQDIFLPRVAVKYSWTVETTSVEDVYIIDLKSTFETYVPMPVVTIQPAHLDTVLLEKEINSTVEFTITNHGLIRADNLRFSLPTTHPYLTFESTVDFIGSIDANTSIVVPIRTVLKHREKRSSGSVCVHILLLYSYQCSGTQTRSAFVRLTRGYHAGSCGGSIRFHGHLHGHGSGYALAYISTTSLTCDCLKTFLKSCVLSFVPGLGCPLAVFNYMTADHSSDKASLDEALGTLDILVGCFGGGILGNIYTAVRCIQDLEAKCSGGRTRREVNSDVVNAVVLAAGPMMNFINLAQEIIGNQSLAIEETWYEEFKKGVGDHTELGVLLSKTESSAILDTITDQTYKANLNTFLERFNNTASAWENGTLPQLEGSGRVISFTSLNPKVEQFISDINRSKERGFGSIFEEYEYAVKAYYDAEEKESSSGAGRREGVCARVRIRIEQELVLTRDAFKAKLEIENGETSDLEQIKVEIQIKQTSGSNELWNDKFSIGKPTLIGISSVDGMGRLGRDLSGSADWLIIPYSNAAPEDNTEYNIGGQLSYSVGGTDFSIPLLPDTVTVSPNPSLIVHYFHEKYVRGDDALTPEIEPIVPFTLAVMVTNDGYGVARALKITSGQPEIIENEKGLLITFKIIAAQLGNNPIAPSLTVDFGDISSFETKTARWLLTSTLMGKFYNYSATFENINPLGDPQLSLIDTLQYHDLIHLVRIDIRDNDDGLDDFLVNNFPDQGSIPDRLYDSENGADFANVFYVNVTDIQIRSYVSSSMKVYKQVNLTLHTNTSVWFYTRIENTFTSSDISAKETLLNVVTQYGRNILLDKNAWQTTHIHNKFYLHLFDFIRKETFIDARDVTEMVYILTYGPKNIYSPQFNTTSFSKQVPLGASVGFEVSRVTAYDRDQDNLAFKFRNESIIPFGLRAITSTSVAITVNEKLKSPGLLLLQLVVYDDGIPPRSTVLNISILVIDGELDTSTAYSSSRTTEYASTTNIRVTSPGSDSSSQSVTITNTTKANIADDETSSWVIPLVIGCSVVIILIMIAVVCFLRKKQVIFRGSDNTFQLKYDRTVNEETNM